MKLLILVVAFVLYGCIGPHARDLFLCRTEIYSKAADVAAGSGVLGAAIVGGLADHPRPLTDEEQKRAIAACMKNRGYQE